MPFEKSEAGIINSPVYLALLRDDPKNIFINETAVAAFSKRQAKFFKNKTFLGIGNKMNNLMPRVNTIPLLQTSGNILLVSNR